MADNCIIKIHETLYTLLFEVFLIHSQRKTYEVPTRYRADTGKVFFIISILKQSSRYRRRQRVGTSRYCYDLYSYHHHHGYGSKNCNGLLQKMLRHCMVGKKKEKEIIMCVKQYLQSSFFHVRSGDQQTAATTDGNSLPVLH